MAIIATAGSGLITLVVAGLTLGWSDWRDVVSLVCSVSALAAIVTTISMPMVDKGRRDPLPGMDSLTKRRALRCIRHGDRAGAPVGVDLEQVAFFWGRAQMRALRLFLPTVVFLVAGALTATGLWSQIFRIALVLVTVPFAVYGIRDVRLCRRFLITDAGNPPPRG